MSLLYCIWHLYVVKICLLKLLYIKCLMFSNRFFQNLCYIILLSKFLFIRFCFNIKGKKSQVVICNISMEFSKVINLIFSFKHTKSKRKSVSYSYCHLNEVVDVGWFLYPFQNVYLPNDVEMIWMNDSQVKPG